MPIPSASGRGVRGGDKLSITDKLGMGAARSPFPHRAVLSANNSPDANDRVPPLLSLTYHARRLMY